MRSMTGFGRATAAGDNFSITVELKTVNNRFLDVNLRLSSEVQSLETAIKRTIGNRLSRGRVDVNLQYERNNEVSYEINRPMITGYLAAMRSMKDEFDLAGEPDLNVIARLPNVVVPSKEEAGPEFFTAIETVLADALDDLEKMREAEGASLADELSSRLTGIESRLPAIEAESAKVGAEYHERLLKRMNDMLSKTASQFDIDQGRLAQEVAYLADRADISEEITRLRTHIEHFRTIMSDDKDVGKRLDFLTQELNREANTITSKTNNMVVKENALAIKSEIEKIREQVQNIE
ncbi:MAG TPA: YicC family protein [Pyrinomonadaceae bacterium]|nr:YicC family protein [Chloracidobacterium sp.]MBL0239461.1 YicC family protein [Chloracidobacterium sp.]MBP9936834.1 YicC family protein [Pyrinomonadaceae bacterium]HQY68415.1 YicC family protein [Pyrinomonadaceae bacterium]